MKIIYWIAKIIAAVLMLQTLFFKFAGASESIYIFTTVHMEPWGRYGVGTLELVAAVTILLESTAWLGALLTLGLMAGAIGMHLTILGIEVQGDHGQLFLYAVIIALAALYVLYVNRQKVRASIASLTGK